MDVKVPRQCFMVGQAGERRQRWVEGYGSEKLATFSIVGYIVFRAGQVWQASSVVQVFAVVCP